MTEEKNNTSGEKDQRIQAEQTADNKKKKKKRSYEKELFMKGFKIGQKVGLAAVTVTGLASGVGILKTIAKKIIKRS